MAHEIFEALVESFHAREAAGLPLPDAVTVSPEEYATMVDFLISQPGIALDDSRRPELAYGFGYGGVTIRPLTPQPTAFP